jgi:hypothetical protein
MMADLHTWRARQKVEDGGLNRHGERHFRKRTAVLLRNIEAGEWARSLVEIDCDVWNTQVKTSFQRSGLRIRWIRGGPPIQIRRPPNSVVVVQETSATLVEGKRRVRFWFKVSESGNVVVRFGVDVMRLGGEKARASEGDSAFRGMLIE